MQLVSVKELSAYLNVKASTLYSWVQKGLIPFHKLNGLVRFDLGEVEAWIKESRPVPSAVSIELPKSPPLDLERIIRRAIDGSKGKAYNPSNGKPGHIQGLRKG